MVSILGPTYELANYAVEAKFEDLPAEVVEKAKVLVLGVLGSAVGGSPLSLSKTFLSLARDVGGGTPEASLISTGEKVSAPFAAFGNGALASMLDFNDFYSKGLSLIWPGHIGVPAAMAAAEKAGISGEDFLNSVVVGYEVSSRIANSMSWSIEQFMKVNGESASVFAAAAAAGKAYNANQEEMISTLGMAGVYAPVSAVGKYIGPNCHPMRDIKQAWAWMCMTGVFVAESAKQGLRMIQTDNILDGEKGFWVMAGADGFDENKLTAGLGVTYNILSALTKNHPGGANTHGAIDAVNVLVRENNLNLSDIERVDVMVESIFSPGSCIQEPKGLVDAEFSVPYQVAVSLLAGEQGPAWYSDEMLRNPEILSMSKKVNVIADEECTRAFIEGAMGSSYLTKVEIRTKSEKQYGKRIVAIKTLSMPDEYREKFMALAQQVIGGSRAGAIMKAVSELDKAENLNGLINQLYPI